MKYPWIMIAALLWLVAAASMAAEPAGPEPHAPSVKETMAAVGQISHELKLIEVRLGKIETAVAGVNASLAPLGVLAQPGACAIRSCWPQRVGRG